MTLPEDDLLFDEEPEQPYRPGPLTILITVLVILALVTTLIWPLIRTRFYTPPRPTPTPIFLQEA
jgi:hypothetical protein